MSQAPPSSPVRSSRAAFVRYAIVGAAQNGVFYLANLGLLALGWQSWEAFALTYPLSVLSTFFANRAWSFAGRQKIRGQFGRHLVVYALAYPTTLGISWLFQLFAPAWFATLCTIGIIAVAIFIASNLWVYPKRRHDEEPAGPVKAVG